MNLMGSATVTNCCCRASYFKFWTISRSIEGTFRSFDMRCYFSWKNGHLFYLGVPCNVLLGSLTNRSSFGNNFDCLNENFTILILVFSYHLFGIPSTRGLNCRKQKRIFLAISWFLSAKEVANLLQTPFKKTFSQL